MSVHVLELYQLAGLEPTESQLQQLEHFADELYAANASRNLTRVPRAECHARHFVDSVLHQRWIPEAARVLDIGTGPGLPAYPLAVLRPDLHVTAIDSNGKMTAFLATQVLPNLEVVQARAEDWSVEEAFDVVTGRAVAPLPLQLELSARPAKIGGLVIPLRTSAEASEFARPKLLSRLALSLESTQEVSVPYADSSRAFPIYRKLKATPAQYPRRWAEMKNRPL